MSVRTLLGAAFAATTWPAALAGVAVAAGEESCQAGPEQASEVGGQHSMLQSVQARVTASSPPTPEFELWKTGAECVPNGKRKEKNLGKFDSLDECRDACLEEGGEDCNYFIYGQTGTRAERHCWWEFDTACNDRIKPDPYNIYRRASLGVPSPPTPAPTPLTAEELGLELWKEGAECVPNGRDNEDNLGRQDTLEECRDACIEDGGDDCNYFIYGQVGTSKERKCWWEFDKACESGTESDKFNIYKLIKTS